MLLTNFPCHQCEDVISQGDISQGSTLNGNLFSGQKLTIFQHIISLFVQADLQIHTGLFQFSNFHFWA